MNLWHEKKAFEDASPALLDRIVNIGRDRSRASVPVPPPPSPPPSSVDIRSMTGMTAEEFEKLPRDEQDRHINAFLDRTEGKGEISFPKDIKTARALGTNPKYSARALAAMSAEEFERLPKDEQDRYINASLDRTQGPRRGDKVANINRS